MASHSHNPWIPIADLMSGFVVVLMILFATVAALQRFRGSANEKGTSEEQAALFDELEEDLRPYTDARIVVLDRVRQSIELSSDASFKEGSACLNAGAQRAVDAIALAVINDLQKDGDLTIQVEGHTDPKRVSSLRESCGHFSDNIQLSERRATNVKKRIASTLDSTQRKLLERMPVIGWGPDCLRNRTSPYASENRRVELHFAWRLTGATTHDPAEAGNVQPDASDM
jgi:flagellar motor protein MotB